jgi:hypothetical protein
MQQRRLRIAQEKVGHAGPADAAYVHAGDKRSQYLTGSQRAVGHHTGPHQIPAQRAGSEQFLQSGLVVVLRLRKPVARRIHELK